LKKRIQGVEDSGVQGVVAGKKILTGLTGFDRLNGSVRFAVYLFSRLRIVARN